MEEASLDQLDPATRRALYRRALVRPLLTVTALLGSTTCSRGTDRTTR